MSTNMQRTLQHMAEPEHLALLRAINRGIEKESLRITPTGKLAQTPHPRGLGSALTHSAITTDYSEALLEFITPVSDSIDATLDKLENIHAFVYSQLDEELLWSASMPCIVSGDEGIPVAQYGSSNVARMKTVYRYGLGHRYGRLMQAISGIHYNFSVPQQYWELAWREAGSPGEIGDYITERYLGLIRNFRRVSWLLIYLFGASPAVCASFLRGRDNHGLQPFDEEGKSLYLPYGTALRMGDLGYNSDAQKGLKICYNNLHNYVETLGSAIVKPHPGYADIPAGQDGDYQQLNTSLLQIENEFYSPIRPKRVANSGEAPLKALLRGGIEYIEVRCIDVSPFCPTGISAEQIRFLDTFLLYCLFKDSPECDDADQAEQAANLEAVVNRGRQPGLELSRDGKATNLATWAESLLEDMAPIADLLDAAHGQQDYRDGVLAQRAKVADPELTPSARILREMRERELPFFRLAMSYSEQWSQYYQDRPLSAELQQDFASQAEQSLADQAATEAADDVSFEQYLDSFFQQYQSL